MDQYVAHHKQPAESNEASNSYQKASIKNLIVEKSSTRVLTPGLIFQNHKVEESLKTQNLKDESFHYLKPFI